MYLFLLISLEYVIVVKYEWKWEMLHWQLDKTTISLSLSYFIWLQFTFILPSFKI